MVGCWFSTGTNGSVSSTGRRRASSTRPAARPTSLYRSVMVRGSRVLVVSLSEREIQLDRRGTQRICESQFRVQYTERVALSRRRTGGRLVRRHRRQATPVAPAGGVADQERVHRQSGL